MSTNGNLEDLSLVDLKALLYRRQLLKKVCIFMSMATFWTAAAITATIPMNFTNSTAYLNGSNDSFDRGDISWMIITTILGLMVPPLTAFYHGSVEGTSSSSMVYVSVATAAVITLLWVFVG